MLEIVKKLKVIKINEVEYSLKQPTYKDSIEYDKAVLDSKDDTKKKIDCLFDYLEKLGLPKEISTDLEIENITEIMNYLSGVKKN